MIKEVNSTCLELLLLEVVPMTLRVSQELNDPTAAAIKNSKKQQESVEPLDQKDQLESEADINYKFDQDIDPYAGKVNYLVDQAYLEKEDVIYRMETYGYNIGLRFGELLNFKLYHGGDLDDNNNTSDGGGSVGFAPLSENKLQQDILNVMKFICRDVWKSLYGKQIDNLRTNHRGAFVLIDNKFSGIAHMSVSKKLIGINYPAHTPLNEVASDKAKLYLWFPCGIIRGVLSSLGIDSNVRADITEFPEVSFSIHTNVSE